jgi:hypothetical protein
MLNEPAKKLVARAARVAAKEHGAPHESVTDLKIAHAWRDACSLHPEFREWPSAEAYFEEVYFGEFGPAAGGTW